MKTLKLYYPSLLILGICCMYDVKANAQALPADTSFTADISFKTNNGDPLGRIIYKATSGYWPFGVFEYTDGRKYAGSLNATAPYTFNNYRIYYPDGTIYMADNSNSSVYYPDGTIFMGRDEAYRQRYGFQFAPDGTYIAGSFWLRKPWSSFIYVTVNYSADHKRLSDVYHINMNDPDMDFETFLKAYKKIDPKEISPYQKISWEHGYDKSKAYGISESYRYKTKDNEAVAFTYYSQKKPTGEFFVSVGSNFYNKRYTLSYNEPDTYVSVTVPYPAGPSMLTRGTKRIKKDYGMVFEATDGGTDPKNNADIMVCLYNGGEKYLGAMDQDKRNGYGIYTASDNSVYFGNFVDGYRSGWGTCRYADGSYYKGAWKNDQPLGPGRVFSKSGELSAEGLFEDGKLVKSQPVSLDYYESINEFPVTSKAIATTLVTNKILAGGTYTGSIAGEMPEGIGTLTMNNTADTYTGTWHNGLPDGVFTVTYAPVKIGAETVSGTYKGGLKDFRREGEGRLVLTSGEMSGTFHEGKLNGMGLIRTPDGMAERGTFVNNVKEGDFEILSKIDYHLGDYTYEHGVRNGSAYLEFPTLDRDMRGQFVNGKMDGKWTVYARNMHSVAGALISAPSQLGYVTYSNGVQVSTQSSVAPPNDVNNNNGVEKPMCSYCSGTGTVNSGKTFMGRDIPARCPRCGGTGRTWLNLKN